MRLPRKLVAAFVLVGLLLVSAPSVFADTTHEKNGTQTFVDVLPCAGPGLFTITLTYNAVEHESTAANGSTHETFTMTGTFTAVPVSGSGTSYSGHFTIWDGDNGNAQNATFTFTFSIHARGSDGSRLTFHETVHFSVSATGLVVFFDKPHCA
jgi:hypothetical protein